MSSHGPVHIRKFTFAATYNYDIKFKLKKQMKPALKWNKINNSMWTKCFSGFGRDGFHHGAPSSTAFKKMTEQITRPAMISTSPDVPDQSADSHTNATNASSLVTTKRNVLNREISLMIAIRCYFCCIS